MMALKVLKKELKENLRKKRIILSAGLFLIIGTITTYMVTSQISSFKILGLDGIITVMIFLFPLLITVVVYSMIAADVVVIEKMKKGDENLLATPITVRDLILGKGTFFLLFSYPLILVVMLVFLWQLYTNNIPFSTVFAFVHLGITLPVVMFLAGIIIITVILQYRSGLVIVQLLIFVVVFGSSTISYFVPSVFKPQIGTTSLISLPIVFTLSFAIIVILAVVAGILVRYASKEKIVLTS